MIIHREILRSIIILETPLDAFSLRKNWNEFLAYIKISFLSFSENRISLNLI